MFAGLFVGPIFLGHFADRFGRRTVFTFSLIWYSITTAIMALQTSGFAVNLWRFIAGVGIGIELVTIDTYVSELVARSHRGRAEGDRRSAPEDRAAAGRVRFSCRAARHLPIAERRAMIAPEAGLSVSRQCALLALARSSFDYRPQPECAEELQLLKRLDRIFTRPSRLWQPSAPGGAVARGDFGWPPARPAADAEARAVGGPAEAEHQQAASRAPGLPVPSARQDDPPGEPKPALAKAGCKYHR